MSNFGLQNCNEHSLKAFSRFLFHFLIILLYTHESSSWSLCMQETPLVKSNEKENKGNEHTRQKCFHGSKKYKRQPWIVVCLIMLCFIFIFLFYFIFPEIKKRKCYSLSFQILGRRDSTRALQSTRFKIQGG